MIRIVDITIAPEFGIDFFPREIFLALQHQESRAFTEVEPLPVLVEGFAGRGSQDLQGIEAIDGVFCQTVDATDNGSPYQSIADQPGSILDRIARRRTGGIDGSHGPAEPIAVL